MKEVTKLKTELPAYEWKETVKSGFQILPNTGLFQAPPAAPAMKPISEAAMRLGGGAVDAAHATAADKDGTHREEMDRE